MTVIAQYLVHDQNGEFEKKAEKIAIGLTVGSWTDLPELGKAQLLAHKGEVVEVREIEESADGVRRGLISISFPAANYSFDLPAILTTTFGKLSLDGSIKLIDLHFSNEIQRHFKGPRFGIQGVRELTGAYDRPLVMSIFKAAIGRSLDSLHEQMLHQALGGVDLVKDDEILFENELTPLEQRVPVGLAAIAEAAEETGNRPLYAVNLTGKTFELKERAKTAIELGAPALLFNVFTYGLDVLQGLREDPEIDVPILAHPAFSGAITSSSRYGVSNPLLLGKLLRMAGADLVLFPSPYGSVAMPKQETLQIAQALRTAEEPYAQAFPVPSAGIHPGMTAQLIEDFGIDTVINAGGGIHGHPEGASAGGAAFREAIDGVLSGQTLEEKAESSLNLRKALDTWGLIKV
ncbi:2,3-diketo-5-methylthiopentyl-1-phosphate enolase [Alkalihalophilus marmarensis]|jgi:2,3-diketo-5-methylthiopentyl-1-phosphate enolase|uniref:2,3-diketo-5-methylthiopentyl-1-phosphate enolase n=1 Tax=Alkalihalophilus marmarensis TaxID=521377 RepID=UPI002041FA86|nr:2,3-diketo-5-methylthiopentyl-1-phosphate enolase [Alkalihalophilus marmarensis]MCM3490532.1 2,3-diketo-5-methylthiopentyl-1-phosphate enolase [Alkalihalophilus marmarensis]